MRILAFILFTAAALNAQRFYSDDPLEFEPPPRPVKDIKNRKLSDYFDLLNNQFRDDEFWGAKLVTAFTDEDIRAIVSMGQLSDKKAEDWLVECLIKRRDKVGQVYFSKVLPLDKFAIRNGEVVWEDLGAAQRLPSADVSLQWSSYDTASGARTTIEEQVSKRVPAIPSGYTCLTLQDRKTPSHTIDVFLNHDAGAPRIVGVDRHW